MTTYAGVGEEIVETPWWLVLLEGIASVIIGLMLLTSPGATLVALVQIMGIFWLIGGIFRIISIFLDRGLWGLKLIGGIVGVLAGLFILDYPLWSSILVPTVLVTVMGVQGIIIGIAILVMAFRGGGLGAGILGALSLILGLLLVANSWLGAAVLPTVMGVFGLVGGIAAIVTAFRMRP